MKKSKPKEFLDAALFKKNTRWKVDQDYTKDLRKLAAQGNLEAIEALKFLSQFNNEYYGSTFSKNDNKNLIKGKQAKKDIYAMRNSENRDVYSNKANLGLLGEFQDSLIEKEGKEDEN